MKQQFHIFLVSSDNGTTCNQKAAGIIISAKKSENVSNFLQMIYEMFDCISKHEEESWKYSA